MKGSRVQVSDSARRSESAPKAQVRKEKSRCKKLHAAFFIADRMSRSDFRIVESAPAASRRDKSAERRLSLGFGSMIRKRRKAQVRKDKKPLQEIACGFFSLRTVRREAIFGSSKAPLPWQAVEPRTSTKKAALPHERVRPNIVAADPYADTDSFLRRPFFAARALSISISKSESTFM